LALVCCAPVGRAEPSADASPDAIAPPWSPEPADEPAPRPGMAWVPPGVLIAGTPLDKLTRAADEEMAGEQVVMHGFYVDVSPWPDEAGAIPTTNSTWGEAREICDKPGKRLCTELELERACEGLDNLTYEYGEAYKPAVCGTGQARSLIPNGFNTGCQS